MRPLPVVNEVIALNYKWPYKRAIEVISPYLQKLLFGTPKPLKKMKVLASPNMGEITPKQIEGNVASPWYSHIYNRLGDLPPSMTSGLGWWTFQSGQIRSRRKLEQLKNYGHLSIPGVFMCFFCCCLTCWNGKSLFSWEIHLQVVVFHCHVSFPRYSSAHFEL